MNHQLRVGEGDPKRQTVTLNTGSREPKLTDDSVVGDEVDPADFLDPEEFDVYRRDSQSSHP